MGMKILTERKLWIICASESASEMIFHQLFFSLSSQGDNLNNSSSSQRNFTNKNSGKSPTASSSGQSYPINSSKLGVFLKGIEHEFSLVWDLIDEAVDLLPQFIEMYLELSRFSTLSLECWKDSYCYLQASLLMILALKYLEYFPFPTNHHQRIKTINSSPNLLLGVAGLKVLQEDHSGSSRHKNQYSGEDVFPMGSYHPHRSHHFPTSYVSHLQFYIHDWITLALLTYTWKFSRVELNQEAKMLTALMKFMQQYATEIHVGYSFQTSLPQTGIKNQLMSAELYTSNREIQHLCLLVFQNLSPGLKAPNNFSDNMIQHVERFYQWNEWWMATFLRSDEVYSVKLAIERTQNFGVDLIPLISLRFLTHLVCKEDPFQQNQHQRMIADYLHYFQHSFLRLPHLPTITHTIYGYFSIVHYLTLQKHDQTVQIVASPSSTDVLLDVSRLIENIQIAIKYYEKLLSMNDTSQGTLPTSICKLLLCYCHSMIYCNNKIQNGFSFDIEDYSVFYGLNNSPSKSANYMKDNSRKLSLRENDVEEQLQFLQNIVIESNEKQNTSSPKHQHLSRGHSSSKSLMKKSSSILPMDEANLSTNENFTAVNGSSSESGHSHSSHNPEQNKFEITNGCTLEHIGFSLTSYLWFRAISYYAHLPTQDQKGIALLQVKLEQLEENVVTWLRKLLDFHTHQMHSQKLIEETAIVTAEKLLDLINPLLLLRAMMCCFREIQPQQQHQQQISVSSLISSLQSKIHQILSSPTTDQNRSHKNSSSSLHRLNFLYHSCDDYQYRAVRQSCDDILAFFAHPF
jgi:hypothetical protein